MLVCIEKVFCGELFQDRFLIDVWSYGVLTWELLTRTKPYKGLQQREILIGVPSGLAFSIFDHCHWLHGRFNYVLH